VKRRWRWALAALPLAFLAVFFVWPVTAIVVRGLRPDGRWDLSPIVDVVTDPVIRRVAWFTLWQAVASTVLTLVVGLPGAALFARYAFRGKRVIWAALVVPFVLPTVVVGIAFLGVIGPTGVLAVDLSGTVWAILIAHVFFNYAVVVRTVGGFWASLDPDLADAARVLGASPWRAFREVTWPLLRPAVAAAASIVFLFTFTSFGVVLILGGIRNRTLEVEIYDQTARFLRLDVAAGLALVQLVFVVATLAWFARTQERRAVGLRPRSAAETARPVRGWRARSFLFANLAVMGVLLVLPLGVLVVRSFRVPGGGWGTDFYGALSTNPRGSTSFVPPLEAVANSLLFAVGATLVAVVLGALAAWAIAAPARRSSSVSTSDSTTTSSAVADTTTAATGAISVTSPPSRRSRGSGWQWVDTALMIPLGTSAVTVGFGFLIALDEPPLDLRDSLWLIPLAHAVVALPFVIRLLVPALRAIDPELRDAAAVLGASPWRVWREIDLPVVGRAMAAAAGFAFAVSLGEFGATVFLAQVDRPTLPVAIYRFLGRPGPLEFGQAMALSTILMALTVVVVLAIDRLRPPGASEF
jgi:thiamine transport system permease protein